jgi:hypothetical protein
MTDDLDYDATDPLDAELRRRFMAGSSTDSDPDAVLDTMRPRLQRARTRRRMSVASAVGAVAAVAIVLLFALGSGGSDGGSVRTPPASRSPIVTVPPAPTTAPPGDAATPDTTLSGGNGGDGSNVGPPASIPGDTVPGEGGNDTTVTTSPSPPVSSEHSYTSDGGSIIVLLADGQVSLVSSAPASGFAADVHDNGPTRVEVRFTNGQTEWRIRVDVVDGQLVPEITQH